MSKFLNISTDTTLGGNSASDDTVSSQKAVKNYVDGQIPTVNNATLTIQKNGSNVATFTANASSNVTANISVPVVEEYTSAEVDTLWNSISASS